MDTSLNLSLIFLFPEELYDGAYGDNLFPSALLTKLPWNALA